MPRIIAAGTAEKEKREKEKSKEEEVSREHSQRGRDEWRREQSNGRMASSAMTKNSEHNLRRMKRGGVSGSPIALGVVSKAFKVVQSVQ